jgi:sortase A
VSDNDDSQQETEIYDGLEQDDKSVELDGNWYIGVIKIPAINLELPVLRDWSYKNLDIAPCRYSGGSVRGNLVIAAHNYSSFFKRLKELNSGDEIIFTNLSGFSRIYEVDYIEFVNGYDVDSMLAGSENWDLTLFTCTWSGYSRVTVRAVETVDK